MNLYQYFYVNELPEGYDSTRAIGRMGVNYDKAVVTPEGFDVP